MGFRGLFDTPIMWILGRIFTVMKISMLLLFTVGAGLANNVGDDSKKMYRTLGGIHNLVDVLIMNSSSGS
jgi:hypothetical protein